MKTEPKDHFLKCHPEYFEKVWSGEKTFEVRFNDRDFQIGDTVFQQEWNPSTQEYTGRAKVCGEISYILKDYPAIEKGFVVFGFLSLEKDKKIRELEIMNDLQLKKYIEDLGEKDKRIKEIEDKLSIAEKSAWISKDCNHSFKSYTTSLKNCIYCGVLEPVSALSERRESE